MIADGIGDAGLAPRRSERVKVHCTLMNTRYAVSISFLFFLTFHC